MQYAIATLTKLFNFARSASEIIGGCNLLYGLTTCGITALSPESPRGRRHLTQKVKPPLSRDEPKKVAWIRFR